VVFPYGTAARLPTLREEMLSLPPPRFMPCAHCGASVERGAEHECDERRVVEFRLAQLGPEIDSFGEQLSAWLETPRGRFERFYAERTRPR
jgi:hypothetical protein